MYQVTGTDERRVNISVTADELSMIQLAMQMLHHATNSIPVVVGMSDAQQRSDARNATVKLYTELSQICMANGVPILDMSTGGF